MTESKSKTTPLEPSSEVIEPGSGALSRRQLLAAAPALAMAPSLSALLISGEVAAGIAPTDGKIPGYWSPTDPDRAPTDGPKGLELWVRADKVMPSYAMFLTRSARYTGYNVLPGFIAEAQAGELSDGVLIVDQEDRPGDALGRLRRVRLPGRGRGLRFERREANLEPGASAGLALDPELPTRLFHDAVDGRESESGRWSSGTLHHQEYKTEQILRPP